MARLTINAPGVRARFIEQRRAREMASRVTAPWAYRAQARSHGWISCRTLRALSPCTSPLGARVGRPLGPTWAEGRVAYRFSQESSYGPVRRSAPGGPKGLTIRSFLTRSKARRRQPLVTCIRVSEW